MISYTPQPPYYAVIFSSERNDEDEAEYEAMSDVMMQLAQKQDGFLGAESVKQGREGVTISYWQNLDAIKNWKNNEQHLRAQQQGRQIWYSRYKTRICRVEREYSFEAE